MGHFIGLRREHAEHAFISMFDWTYHEATWSDTSITSGKANIERGGIFMVTRTVHRLESESC